MPSIPFDGSKPFRLVPPERFSTGNTIATRRTVPDAMSSTRATSKSSQSFRLVPPPAPDSEHPATQKTIHQRAVIALQKPIDEGEPVSRSSAAHHAVTAPSTSQQFRLVPPPAPAQDMKSATHYTVGRPPTREPFSLAPASTAALVLEQGTTQQRAANTGVDDKPKFTRSSAAGSSRHHAATMPSTSQSFRLVPPPAPVQDKIQKSAAHFTVARPPTPVPFNMERPLASAPVAAQETIQQRADGDDVGLANYQKPIDVKALRASAKKALKAQRLRVEQKHQARANEKYYFQHAEVDWETPLSRQELEETLVISLARAVKKAGKTFRKATRLEIAQMVDIKLRSREQASAASELRRPLPKVPASSKSTAPKVKPSPLLDALGFPEDILEMLALSKAVRPERFAALQTISAQRPIHHFTCRENGIEEPETVEQAMGRLVPALLPGEVSLVLEMMSIARAELFQLAMQHEDEYGDESME